MKAVLAGFILFFAAPLAQAQTASIGGVELRLGASKDQVFQVMQPRFNLQAAKQGFIYNVYRLGANGQTQGASIGTIEFVDLRLKRVVSNLGTLQGAEASAVMRRLISTFAQAQPGGGQVSVNTDINETVTAVTSWVYFRLPEKIIQIAVYEPKTEGAPVTIDITEQYSLP